MATFAVVTIDLACSRQAEINFRKAGISFRSSRLRYQDCESQWGAGKMTEHVSTSQMERFCVQASSETDRALIAKHLADGETCHELMVVTLKRRSGDAPIKFTLAPEFWFRHAHVDYEQLVAISDEALDSEEREILNLHLKVCTSCREDVRDFLAFRKEFEAEKEVTYEPSCRKCQR
jgi:hypothetical protein